MGYRKNPPDAAQLRRLAHERVSKRLSGGVDLSDPVQVRSFLEELEMRQIELAQQSAELATSRAQLEAALNQCRELEELSPVGSLTLSATGAITRLNLAASRLLSRDRSWLMGRHFAAHVMQAEQLLLQGLLERTAKAQGEHSVEVTLFADGQPSYFVHIKAAALLHEPGWQLVLVDLTEHRRHEERARVNEERWKLALESAGDGVWDWEVRTGAAVFSSRYAELYGYTEDDYGHRFEDWSARIHPDDKLDVMAQVREHLMGRSAYFSSEHRGRCKDGGWKWVLARGAVVSRTDDGTALRMVGTHVDITRRKHSEDALRTGARFQQAVFDSLSAQVAVVDRNGLVLQVNAAWRERAINSGLSDGSSCIGGQYLELLARLTGNDAQTVAAVAEGMAAVRAGDVEYFNLPAPFQAPGDQRWFTLRITPVHDAGQRMVVSHEDVSDLKAAELASWRLANIDSLTGALSRLNFLNLAEQELARATRYALPLMVLMLDLDHFKRINDRYGHAAGDAVLRGFVQTVAGVLRESDFVGRIGGEEFAVMLPNTTLEGGRALAQRIIESVRASPIEIGQHTINYTVSIGAGCLSGETSFVALLGLADNALYRAKEGGRNRLEVEPR